MKLLFICPQHGNVKITKFSAGKPAASLKPAKQLPPGLGNLDGRRAAPFKLSRSLRARLALR